MMLRSPLASFDVDPERDPERVTLKRLEPGEPGGVRRVEDHEVRGRRGATLREVTGLVPEQLTVLLLADLSDRRRGLHVDDLRDGLRLRAGGEDRAELDLDLTEVEDEAVLGLADTDVAGGVQRGGTADVRHRDAAVAVLGDRDDGVLADVVLLGALDHGEERRLFVQLRDEPIVGPDFLERTLDGGPGCGH
jgi:hypothetical protein